MIHADKSDVVKLLEEVQNQIQAYGTDEIDAGYGTDEIDADEITDEQIEAFLEILRKNPEFGKCKIAPDTPLSELTGFNFHRRKKRLKIGELINKALAGAMIFMVVSWFPGIAHYIKMAPEIVEMTVSYWANFPANSVVSEYPESYAYSDFTEFKEYSWGTVCYLRMPTIAYNCVVFNETLSALLEIWEQKAAENR